MEWQHLIEQVVKLFYSVYLKGISLRMILSNQDMFYIRIR